MAILRRKKYKKLKPDYKDEDFYENFNDTKILKKPKFPLSKIKRIEYNILELLFYKSSITLQEIKDELRIWDWRMNGVIKTIAKLVERGYINKTDSDDITIYSYPYTYKLGDLMMINFRPNLNYPHSTSMIGKRTIREFERMKKNGSLEKLKKDLECELRSLE